MKRRAATRGSGTDRHGAKRLIGAPVLSRAFGVLRGEGRLARSRVKGARCARTFLMGHGRKACALDALPPRGGFLLAGNLRPRKGITCPISSSALRQPPTRPP